MMKFEKIDMDEVHTGTDSSSESLDSSSNIMSSSSSSFVTAAWKEIPTKNTSNSFISKF